MGEAWEEFCRAFDLRLWTAGFIMLASLGSFVLGYYLGRKDSGNRNFLGF